MIQKYIEAFQSRPKSRISWLDQEKTKAFERFSKSGFPTMQMEEWKDINLSPITGKFFQMPTSSVPSSVSGFWEKHDHIVFQNGFQVAQSLQLLGVQFMNFRDAFSGEAKDLVSTFGMQPKLPNAFFDLNTSFAQEGSVLHVQKNVNVERPIYIVHISNSTDQVHHYRNMILMEPHSKAHIIEIFVSGTDSSPSWTIPVTQIHLLENAELEHVKFQNESLSTSHTSNTIANLSKSSRLKTYSFSLGCSLARNDIQIGLRGEGSECVIDGLYIVGNKQVVDHHTTVNHVEENCQSFQTYKGVLLDQSHGIFEGKIFVEQKAQHTDAKQLNQNLLLSPNAQVHTAPQLQILADDVKCSHGATIGKLDEDQVFYLRSRGIEESQARRMLVHAYADEVVSKVTIPSVVEELQKKVSEKIHEL